MNANLNAAHTVTDTIGNSGTIRVDLNTTPDAFAAWYAAGAPLDPDVRGMLDAALDTIQGHDTYTAALDALGLSVETVEG